MAAIPESLSALATTPIPETLSLPLSEPKLKTNVVQATESDVTALAELMSLSHGPELIMSIFFPDWPRTKTMVPFFEARLQASFAKEPGGKVFKAVTGNGEIVGCVAMMLRSGEKEGKGILGVNVDNVKGEDDDDGLEAVKERARNLKGANIDFLAHVVQGIEGLDNFVEGVKCYGLSQLAVHPNNQGQGIGKKLMKACENLADKDGLSIFLTAYPGAMAMYKKMGYRDLGQFDVDLNEWSRVKNKGLGIYRSTAMLRDRKKGT